MNNILIISGGAFDVKKMSARLKGKKYDYIIAADSGAEYAASLGLKPDVILGDLDSVSAETLEHFKNEGCPVKEFRPEKDETDFDIALKEAISLNPEKITILGATGTRLDHTFTTFFCIMRMLETGVDCEIIDPNNRIYFRNIDFVIRKKEQYGNFVSLVPVTESVILSIKGMKYPLENKKVFRGESLCQSNEIVNEKADISVSDGTVAVFESMD